jgi:hypothetical protein
MNAAASCVIFEPERAREIAIMLSLTFNLFAKFVRAFALLTALCAGRKIKFPAAKKSTKSCFCGCGGHICIYLRARRALIPPESAHFDCCCSC